MAQGIKAMWILDGEQYDNAVHNYNRYGIQLRQKVITSVGRMYGSTLREWTQRPKNDEGGFGASSREASSACREAAE